MFLSDDEQRVYNLIAASMEKAFSAPHHYTEVVLEICIDGELMYGSVEMPYGYLPEDDTLTVNPTGASMLTLTPGNLRR